MLDSMLEGAWGIGDVGRDTGVLIPVEYGEPGRSGYCEGERFCPIPTCEADWDGRRVDDETLLIERCGPADVGIFSSWPGASSGDHTRTSGSGCAGNGGDS